MFEKLQTREKIHLAPRQHCLASSLLNVVRQVDRQVGRQIKISIWKTF